MAKPPDPSFFISGHYLEIEIPCNLTFTFRYTGVRNTPPDSVVKITWQKLDENTTTLFLEQEFASEPTDLKKRNLAWEYMFDKLTQLCVLDA